MRGIGYTKVRNVKGQDCHPKKEKPPRSRYLQGGFFAPSGTPKPLPLGEVALRSNDGEGKPVSREPPRSDRQARCQSDTIAAQSCLAASLPSQALRASSPRGRALGRPGHFLLPARGPIWRKRAGLATEGSSFWTSAPCQAAAALDSGALPFPRHRALLVPRGPARHARGSPTRGAVRRSLTERFSPQHRSRTP